MIDSQLPISTLQSLDLPECVPARMVNEFAYCPRLAYLEWVQGDFADSADTVDGRYKHRVVDQERGALPAADADLQSEIEKQQAIHARSVWLSAPEEWLTARIDLIEGDGDSVMPVDYKRGARPDHLPESAWEPDRVQLCAQGLVLRANGYRCERGVIYYIESKTRVMVEFDDALIARTRELVRGLRELGASGRIPPPLEDSPKCPRCSLVGICLPDETRLLAAHETADGADDERVRRLMPARDDALPLYVQEQGARIGKSGEVLEVWLKDRKLGESRLFETSHVALFGSVQISTQALTELMERDIPVALFTTGGWFHGLAHGMSHKNVELRQAQFRAADDPARSLALAKGFIVAKIRNCRTLVMRNHPNPPAEVVDGLQRLAREAQAVESAGSLFGVEALAAKQYFSVFNGMLKGRANGGGEWSFDFNGRNRRPPRDPVNALLSYAYSLLVKEFTVTALLVGLDPFLGFFHRPRYGRPSLALDLMEEFRPLIGDSVTLNVINTGVITAGDFIRRGPACTLTPEGRKKFLRAYEQRLDTLITHPVFGYRISYRRVLEVQTRLLGRLLTGELSEYPAFVTR
jgi:CRISPR-associated protein Cas1